MIKKQQQFLIKGMNQDISETKVQPELAHGIKNLRVITDEDSGTFSLVTEKGTQTKIFPNNFFTHSNQISNDVIPTYSHYGINLNDPIAMRNSNAYVANTMYEAFLKVNVYFKLKYSDDYKNLIASNTTGNITFSMDPVALWNKYVVGSNGSFTKYSVIRYNNYESEYEGNIGSTNISDYNDLKSYISNNTSYDSNSQMYTIVTCIPILIDASYIPSDIFDGGESSEQKINKIIQYLKDNVIYRNELVRDIRDSFYERCPVYNLRIEYISGNNTYTLSKLVKLKNILNTTVVNKDLIVFGLCSFAYYKTLQGQSGSESELMTLDDKSTIIKLIDFNGITSDSTVSERIKFLYTGNLNFNINNPIKTYVSYESENQQRVYWIDGLNQPRVINVADGISYETFDADLDNHFDFCTPIYLNEQIEITKNSLGGMFHSGVIQYFMTYVDQNDQESKIFYASHLYYITDNDSALSPESVSTNSFVINLRNINAEQLFRKKLRIYSLHRTSLNAVPVCKLIYELKLATDTSNLNVVDTGNVGMNIDPQILLMLGCDEFIPKTIEVKDNTLFFGNIKTNAYGQSASINEILGSNSFFETNVSIQHNDYSKYIKKRDIGNNNSEISNTKEFQLNGTPNPNDDTSVHLWNISGSDNDIKGFMYQEEYMLGVQLLHKSGEWSDPIWVCDKIMTNQPAAGSYHKVPYFQTTYSSTTNNELNKLIDSGYIAIRPLVVCNDYSSARVLCCGVLNPVLKYKDTLLSSWFFRPVKKNTIYIAEFDDPTLKGNAFSYINALGNDDDSKSLVTEIQPIVGSSYLASTEVDSSKASDFKITGTWRTFNSPEFEFEKINTITNNYNFCVCSDIPIHHVKYDIEMLTSTTTETLGNNYGFRKNSGTVNYMSGTTKSSMTFVGGNRVWVDKDEDGYIYTQVFPWHNNVSYSGNLDKEGHHKGSDLIYGAPEKKTITNWRISQHPDGIKTIPMELDITDIAVVNENSIFINGFNYLKDVDMLIIGGTNDVGDVRIQYKSTPHAIIKFDYYNLNGYTSDITYAALSYGYLKNKFYDINKSIHFKGRTPDGKPTDTSLYENTWYIAGDTVKLSSNTSVTVKWTKGDTYYQRYNCLKTYPFSHESQNNIIDILSFMVQTRINIDGTYDKQKTDILHIEPQNFNRLNDVYSQMDNFFTYRKLDPDKFQNTFPNLITWSRQKVFGESIDSWTNIHLTNVLDLDGSLGEITAIKLWNNKLIAFQNKGISVIKYNENVMIPSVSGTPIEIMNSGLVTGRECISNQFGCQNEWSIVNAKSGLYFSDDYNHKLYVLSDGIKCISDNLGFKSYLKDKNYSDVWKPNRNSGTTLHTYYDQQLGDIYFTDGNSCLTYNEGLNLFTSFYDYIDVGNKKLFSFVNIEDKNYWILNDFTNNTPSFYEHRAIDNLNIFGTNRGYEIELTANIDPHVDKIFDTVEIRGDAYTPNLNSGYGTSISLPFDTLRVSNEYQDTNEQQLNFSKDTSYSSGSNMKQKFRIWRAAIGRNQNGRRDRIRNYWSRIKLKKSSENNLKAKIHDIVVDVYE